MPDECKKLKIYGHYLHATKLVKEAMEKKTLKWEQDLDLNIYMRLVLYTSMHFTENLMKRGEVDNKFQQKFYNTVFWHLIY